MSNGVWDTPPEDSQATDVWGTPPEGYKEVTTPEASSKGVIDFMTKPRETEIDSDAYRQGVASELAPKTVEAPIEAPTLEPSGVKSFLTGRSLSPDEIDKFMSYHISQGKTKNEALAELKKIDGVTGLDLRNAARYGSVTVAPSKAVNEILDDSVERGLARTGLTVAQTSVDIANLLGADTTKHQENLDFAKGKIREQQNLMQSKYGMLSPVEQTVRYAPELATFGIGGGVKTVATLEAATEYALSRADGYDKSQALARAVTVGIIAGGAQRLMDGYVPVNKHGLTDEAETVLDFMNVDRGSAKYKELLSNMRKAGVAPEDQARFLAEQGGAATEGLTRGAIKDLDDKAKFTYAETLASTRKQFAEATELDKFDEIQKATREQYETMRKLIEDRTGNSFFTVDALADELDKFVPFARNDASANKIMRLVEQIKQRPTKSLAEIMDIRQEINYEIGATKNGTAKEMLRKIKAHIDDYFKQDGADATLVGMMDESIKSYNKMKTQEELLDIMKKNTVVKALGSDIGEIKVVNWGKLYDDAVEAGLGKAVEDEIKLIEKLSKKYGSTQADLVRLAGGQGVEPSIDDTLTAIMAERTSSTKVPLFKKVEEILLSWLPTDTGAAYRAQKAIASSMERGKTYKEFLDNVVKHKDTPALIKSKIEAMREVIEEQVVAPVEKAPRYKAQQKADKRFKEKIGAYKTNERVKNARQKELDNRFKEKIDIFKTNERVKRDKQRAVKSGLDEELKSAKDRLNKLKKAYSDTMRALTSRAPFVSVDNDKVKKLKAIYYDAILNNNFERANKAVQELNKLLTPTSGNTASAKSQIDSFLKAGIEYKGK